MRSFWMGKANIASAPVSAALRFGATLQPSFSMPPGMSVEGPPTRTRAPSLLRQWMFERATRLCEMSPTMATVFPSSVPQRSRRESASSSPCVGCSCAPSPALITLAFTARATSLGAPAAGWRSTSASAPMASRLRTVSSSDSPLVTLDASFWQVRTSAPRARAATSNEPRVRVLASKKSVMTVRPRKRPRRSAGGSPARALARSCLKRAASESSVSICSRVSVSNSRRWRGKSTSSNHVQKSPGEMRGEARLEDLPGGLLGVVMDAAELDHLGPVVPDAEACPRVVVARLPAAPDGAEIGASVLDVDALAPHVLHRLAQQESALQVRVPDEVEVGEAFGALEEVLGLLEREDVLEGRGIARRSVPVVHLAFAAAVGERPQPVHVLAAEVQRRPIEHLARGRVVVAVVHAARDGRVVVPEDGELAPLPHQVARRVGVRAVSHGVAEADEAVHFLRFRFRDARRQGFQVGMDVGQDGGPHRRRPQYTGGVTDSSRAKCCRGRQTSLTR